jgi:hypothetical protein
MGRPPRTAQKGGHLPARQLYRRKRVTLRDAPEEAEPLGKVLKLDTKRDLKEGDGDLLLDLDRLDEAESAVVGYRPCCTSTQY